ncbi:hypothetical protein [Nocardia mangyaensis]|uniref:hypothetical protein n=1 Tax=Nocardia mangyaensis TaxID=2213200 RepID=UPI002676D9BD|nr:hypothetical protein [Nocardia mangyaensis]MDO3645409.1 hypothetical protein [Nocardia mangyaensis]
MSSQGILNTYRTARAACLVIAGFALAAYPLLRPYSDEETLAGAQAYASTAWVVSHLLAILGFLLIAAAMLFDVAARPTERGGLRVASTLSGTVAVTLLSLYYGFECFALHEIGRMALAVNSAEGLALADQIRDNPFALTLFGLGWLALGVAVTLWAMALRAGGVPAVFAALVWLYLPVFFLPPAGRIGHGVLVLLAAAGTAWVITSAENGPSDRPATG